MKEIWIGMGSLGLDDQGFRFNDFKIQGFQLNKFKIQEDHTQKNKDFRIRYNPADVA